MFTGIVQQIGRVVAVGKTDGTYALDINLADLTRRVRIGESVAINGVCLTATRKHRSVTSFDVIEETLARTNLHELNKKSTVNVERSLHLSDRIDGHLVLGHVDGVGKIERKSDEHDGSAKIWIHPSNKLLNWMIPKGAIALDGVSLTLVDVTRDKFSACLIPHTMASTTLGEKNVGDSLNIETDFFGKYVKRFVEQLDLNRIQSRTKS